MLVRATKKPVTVEAIQYVVVSKRQCKYGVHEETNSGEIAQWMGKITQQATVPDGSKTGRKELVISTLEGDMRAQLGDWIIKGVNGEFYPCKPDIFEKTYDLDTGNDLMDFGEAIRQAKEGKKIARKGWNGKDMFVVYMEPLWLPPANTQDTMRKVNDRTAKWIGEDAPLDCQPYFAMYNAQKQWIVGWLASQSDMFAEDWYVVGE